MSDERRPDGVPRTAQHVQHARRQDVGRELREAQGRQGRPRRRLEDDGIAGGQRRPQLPAGHVQGIIPGSNRGDHADRLAADERGSIRDVLVDRLALHAASCSGEEAHVVGDGGHVHGSDVEWLARLAGLEARELLGVRLDDVGQLEERGHALLRRRLLPRLERGRRRLDGAVDVLRRARRDSGDDRIVCRIDDLEGLAGAIGEAVERIVLPEAESTHCPPMNCW